jgi:hypothetical protein
MFPIGTALRNLLEATVTGSELLCFSAKQEEVNPDARRQPYRHNKRHQNRFY